MPSLKVNIMNELGKGLSVNTLCQRLEITYEELCKEAEDLELLSELKRWYPLYDFTVKKKEPTIEELNSAEEALNTQPEECNHIEMLVSKELVDKIEEDNSLETKEKPVKKKRTIKKKVVIG